MTDKFSLKQKFSPMQKKPIRAMFSCASISIGSSAFPSVKSEEAEPRSRSAPVPYLPPRAAAWIILLHDLVWNWQHERITTESCSQVLLDEIKKSLRLAYAKRRFNMSGRS